MRLPLLVIFYSIVSLTFAQQVADTTFDFKIEKPYFQKGKGPTIAIDDAHYNFHTLQGRFTSFGKLLGNDGYVLENYSSKLSLKKLNQIDILVISNSLNEKNSEGNWTLPTPSAYGKDEIKALHKWVQNGGKLLLIADHMPMAGAIADLASDFGIHFENAYAMDKRQRKIEYFTKTENTLLNDTVTSDNAPYTMVDSIVNFTGSAFKISGKAYPLMVLDSNYQLLYPDTAWIFHPFTKTVPAAGFYQLARMPYGKGKIIVSAEAAMFTAQLNGSEKKPSGFNSPAAKQNCQFILNLFHWLSNHETDKKKIYRQKEEY